MLTETEKIQLELAKLQLERERRRQRVVNSLGQGAVAAGGAAGSALKWALFVVLGAILGGAAGWIGGAVFSLMRHKFECRAFPDADLLFSMGCIIGADVLAIGVTAAAGVICGIVLGHLHYREKPRSR